MRPVCLLATDGSSHARAAVATALAFPWPRGTRAHGVVARGRDVPAGIVRHVVDAIERNAVRIAANTRRRLTGRWPDVEVSIVDKPAAAAILAEARRLRARAIVMGWRGHGAFRRLLGSVSRDVLRQASCPVLIVRRRPRRVRSFVVGIDGSTNARRAVRFLATLPPPRGGRMTVVRSEEPMSMPVTAGRLPAGIRAILRSEVAKINAERLARAQRDVDAAAATLARRGWTVRTDVRVGAPLDELLAAVAAAGADILVVGARGAGGMKRLLLGSVAEGAVSKSPVPVLVVK
jgi:nucleotide-binding universal stress UspA family protein